MQQNFKKVFGSRTILGSVHALSQGHEVEEATDDKREQPGRLWACSHEPGTVKYPVVMIARGKRYLAFTL